MKTIDIKKETTNITGKYLANGFILEWNDASRGNQTTQFFYHPETKELHCLTVKEESGHGATLDYVKLRLFKIKEWWSTFGANSFSWKTEDEEELTVKEYWQIGTDPDDDWLTEDKAEATAILEKKRERIQRGHRPYKTETPLAPSDAFIEAMRKVPGFEKATAKNLRVSKSKSHIIWKGTDYGYKVELLNRVGNVKTERFYKLG